jgi:MFS family permease
MRMLPLFRRDVRLFLVAVALVALAWDGVRAVLLNLYLLRLGYGPEFVGLVTGAGALAFAVTCLPAGTMGTRWGSRNMLIVGMGLMVLGIGSLLLAEAVSGAWRAGWLVVTSVLAFMGFALYLVNSLPFMMGATGPEERTYAFSVQMALSPISAFVGSLVAGVLPLAFASLLGLSPDDATPYRLSLGLAALLLVPGVLVLLRTHDIGVELYQDPAAGNPSEANHAPYGLIAVVALMMALRFGGSRRPSLTSIWTRAWACRRPSSAPCGLRLKCWQHRRHSRPRCSRPGEVMAALSCGGRWVPSSVCCRWPWCHTWRQPVLDTQVLRPCFR